MIQQEYRTHEIARIIGIHVNTVRFYEKIGFLTAPARSPNGYRVYTQLQLDQCALIRRAMRAEVLQNGLRTQAVEIVKLCAALRLDEAYAAAETYRGMIEREIRNAELAIATVEDALAQSASADEAISLKRAETAQRLHITAETLRTWERSGLLAVKRRKNGYRVYDAADLKRLNIIRTLRCANYSLSAILRLLNGLDQRTAASVEAALNTPEEGESIVSVCDHLIVALGNTRTDAQALLAMIADMRQKYLTLH